LTHFRRPAFTGRLAAAGWAVVRWVQFAWRLGYPSFWVAQYFAPNTIAARFPPPHRAWGEGTFHDHRPGAATRCGRAPGRVHRGNGGIGDSWSL